MSSTARRLFLVAGLGAGIALGTTFAPAAVAPSAQGTYLEDILDAHEGFLYRWPDRRDRPVHVWVQTPLARAIGDATPADLIQRVHEGFLAWDSVTLPVRFAFVTDSSAAEVHVVWVDAFDDRMTGQTAWQHDADGWLLGATVALAHHQPDGTVVTTHALRAIAEHEAGHVLGLDHTSDTTSIMSATIRVTNMNEADRATARLVYALSPGWQVRY